MGLVPAITTEFILSRIDEATIFSAYFQPFKLGESYSSPFRRDRNPSCSFFYNRNGKLIFRDFGRDESYDCFDFVAKKENLEFTDALRRIAVDFGLVKGTPARFNPSQIQVSEDVAEKVKKETIIEYSRGEWTDRDLAYWMDNFYITQQELEREEIYPVKKLRINGTALPNWRQELRFGLELNIGNKQYRKIYTPFADKKHFKWVSSIPNHIPFGINKLPKASNILIISKSQKERILFQKFFTDVIAVQNESRAGLNEKTISYINKYYDVVYLAFDRDEAGFKSSDYYCFTYNYIPLFTPEKAAKKFGVKDWGELVQHYDLEAMEKTLKHYNLL